MMKVDSVFLLNLYRLYYNINQLYPFLYCIVLNCYIKILLKLKPFHSNLKGNLKISKHAIISHLLIKEQFLNFKNYYTLIKVGSLMLN